MGFKCDLFTQEQARKDIGYCIDNAYLQAVVNLDRDNDKFFIRNPHFYLNASDNVLEACRGNIHEGDSVLAVAGSGDYLFEAIFNGAKKVVNFDINSIQYYVLCLKMWAMEQLSYKEYVNFLINFGPDYLYSRVFRKVIEPYKDEAAYPFWAGFMKERGHEQVAINEIKDNPIVRMSLCMVNSKIDPGELDYVIASELGPQLMPRRFRAIRLVQCAKASKDCFSYIANEENYNLVKSRIKDVDISFINANITDLKDKVGEDKFDSVFVSNIPFYLTSETGVKSIRDLLTLLNEGGVVSTYNQGMRISWFKNILTDRKFKLSVREFDVSLSSIKINMVGVSNSLLTHKGLVESGLDVSLRDIPTYGGSPETKADTDILTLIKKH